MTGRPAEMPAEQTLAIPSQTEPLHVIDGSPPTAAEELLKYSHDQGFALSFLNQETIPAWSRVAYSYVRNYALSRPLSERVRSVTLPEPVVNRHLDTFWKDHATIGTDRIRVDRFEQVALEHKASVEKAVTLGKPFPELALSLELYKEAERADNQPVAEGLRALVTAYGMTLKTLGFMQAARAQRGA